MFYAYDGLKNMKKKGLKLQLLFFWNGTSQVRRYLVDFVETCHCEALLQQPYPQSSGKSVTFFPE